MRVYQKIKSILGLSFQLAKASFKMKNEGSFLGILWYLLEPLALFLVFMLIRIGNSNIPMYPLYLLLGLITFNFFSKTTSEAVDTIENNSELIKSLKIDKEVFVVSAVLKSVFSHFFEVIVFFGFMIYFKVSLVNALFYPLIFLFFMMFIFGACFFLSTLGAYASDFSNVWAIISRVIFFGTPIFYVIADFEGMAKIEYFNPLFYFMTIVRDVVVYGRIPEPFLIYGALAFSVFAFLIGLFVFELNKRKFAEQV